MLHAASYPFRLAKPVPYPPGGRVSVPADDGLGFVSIYNLKPPLSYFRHGYLKVQ